MPGRMLLLYMGCTSYSILLYEVHVLLNTNGDRDGVIIIAKLCANTVRTENYVLHSSCWHNLFSDLQVY